MRAIIYLTTLATLILADVNVAKHPLSDDYINDINSKQSSWRAGRNFDPNTPMSELRKLLGVNRKIDKTKVDRVYHNINIDDIPETFDARENWYYCGSTKRIADQSACGSCWAVAAASAMSDRICIVSNTALQPQISAANIMSCCEDCGDGCDGGEPIEAWKYWTTTGIVTGGGYNTTDGCQNYPFPSCEHHNTPGVRPKCPNTLYDTPYCSLQCDESTSYNYEDTLTFGQSYYMVESNEEQIQAEIMKNGPVVADFFVYADFFSYKSGVYATTSDDVQGEHAIRLLGWGTENNVKYWLAANSWNTDWGDVGTFKIQRGTDECGIEGEVSAGIPKI